MRYWVLHNSTVRDGVASQILGVTTSDLLGLTNQANVNTQARRWNYVNVCQAQPVISIGK